MGAIALNLPSEKFEDGWVGGGQKRKFPARQKSHDLGLLTQLVIIEVVGSLTRAESA